MKKQYVKTCLIAVNKGDSLLYEDEEVEVLNFYLTPNGMQNPEIICLIKARKENGNIVEASSGRFRAIPEKLYQEKDYSSFT